MYKNSDLYCSYYTTCYWKADSKKSKIRIYDTSFRKDKELKKQKSICYLVLTYNNYVDTIQTVEGILQQSEIQYIDIVIIDNNSEYIYKSNVSKFAKEHEIKYIYRDVNDGYTGGNNFGWKQLRDKYKYIIIVNNDIIFYSKTLTHTIVKLFELNKNIGIIGPPVYYGSGEIIQSSRVLKIIFNRGINHHQFIRTPEYIECDSVIGCCLAINTEAVKFDDLFDESFFMYGEELDLCLRVWRTGHSVVHLTDNHEKIYHKGGNNPFSEGNNIWKYYLTERNLVLCARNLRGTTKLKFLFVLWVSHIYRLVFGKLDRKQQEIIRLGFYRGLRFLIKNNDKKKIQEDALIFIGGDNGKKSL